MSGFPTGDLNPIYITPMLGTHNLFPPSSVSVPSVLWWNGSDFLRGDTQTIDEINNTVLTDVYGGPFGQDRDMAVFDTHRRCFVWHDTPQFSNSGPAHTREMHFSAKAKPVHQPFEIIFAANQTIQSRAIGAGLRPLNCQWLKEDILITDNPHYSGSATPTLTLTGTTAADTGNHTLRMTNSMNTVFSRNIRLTLQNAGVGVIPTAGGLILSWPGASGILETATTPAGPWTSLHGVTPPYSVATDESHRFYRVRYP